MEVGDIVYYTRIIPSADICNVVTLKIRTVYDNAIVGVDQATQISYLLDKNSVHTNYNNAKEQIDKEKKNED